MDARSRRTIVIGVVIAAVVSVAVFVTGFKFRPYATTCLNDDEIPADVRSAIGRVSLDYASRAMGADSGSAIGLFAAAARESGTTAEKLRAGYEPYKKKLGAVSDWRVAQTYMVHLVGTDAAQQVICGNLAKPDEHVVVAVRGGPAQAHVVVEGESAHGRVVFVFWVVPEGGDWRIFDSYFSPITYMGKTAADFEELAKIEQRDGRLINAALLYMEAGGLSNRGNTMRLGAASRLAKEFESVKVPGPLAGRPPFIWKTEASQFKVLNIEPVELEDGKGHDKLWVVVTHEIDPWVDQPSAEARNQELIAAFRKTYPSYRRIFSGLVMRGQEKNRGQGARGWGTTYLDDEAAPASSPPDLSPTGTE